MAPFAATLSKQRIVLDCPFKWVWWQQLKALLEDGVPLLMLADSSPRLGHDWLRAEFTYIKHAGLDTLGSC